MPIASKVKDYIERASWIRKMFEEGALLREQYGAQNVFDFTLGNPTMEPPAEFHHELKKIADNPIPGMHRYMHNAGYEETRAAVAEVIAENCDQPVTSQQIVMTCGAGAALNVVLKTLLNPGDEVIILTPYFVEYKFYIDNHGGIPVEVITKDDFQPDLDAIASAINNRTRAIIINSPNNPTGVIYPETTLNALGDLLRGKEQELGTTILAISDEPYARISFGEKVSCIFKSIQNSIIVTSHSKDLALPGDRIGYLAANPKMTDVNVFIQGAIFCNRVLGFVNAPALMQRLVTNLQRTSVNVDEYRIKRDLLYNKLSDLGFDIVKPGGGFYLFPKSPLPDEMEFIRIAQKYRILLVPGSGFGSPGYFRIAYCVENEMIERSLPLWEKLAREVGLTPGK
ncbi:MAG: pyridoxal phosphate-dependent aminotransferase [Deltaproteobacteria bacterium]|jgi:aspartate aminotransferase|nr:pyridoxal phosphate-dependent aminotransferase [Deltaproteobacteria bacterium]MCW8891961.1 pyridoxal phosphate-dependent aminotransferase [Deltaproteobacteria bacterium]MCW9050622.1 pyridoxal phosphate-dependent aminotransferase [Deltaproteobacteria bacterium]